MREKSYQIHFFDNFSELEYLIQVSGFNRTSPSRIEIAPTGRIWTRGLVRTSDEKRNI